MNPVVETTRLFLREMSLSDLDFVASMLEHPEVMRFWPRCYARAEAEAWVRRQQDRYVQHGHGYWLVVEKATGGPVGQAGLLTLEIDGIEEAALGYLMHRPFWGRGFATEAAAAARDHAFETAGKRRLIAPIRPENLLSQRVALKLGMKPERRTVYAGFEHVIFSVSYGM